MYRICKYVAVTLGLLIWLAIPSWANLSVDQVWDDILKRTKYFGYEVSAIESRSDDILILSDLNLRYDNLDEGYSVNVKIGDMKLASNNDGSVIVSPSNNVFWDFLVPDSATDTVTIRLAQKTSALYFTASGTAGQINYDYSAERIDIVLDEFSVQADVMKSDNLGLQLSLTDVVGKSKITGDKLRETLSSFSAGNFDFMVHFIPNEENYKGIWETRLSNVSFASTGQIPDGFSLQETGLALSEGFNNSIVFNYEAGETEASFSSDKGDVLLQSRSAGGTASNAISRSGFKSMSEIGSVNLTASGGILPFPVTVNLGSLVYRLSLPVISLPEQQNFGLKFELNHLSVSDSVWSTFDPLRALPHDPISLKIDLRGALLLLTDIFSSDVSESALNDLKEVVQVVSLSLKHLLISGFGAEVAVQGEFEFDNQDLNTFQGMPRPVGKAKVKLTGINRFLEKAVKMGLIGSQQAMGLQMTIGMFAEQTGNDIMQTELEIEKNGAVFANGQRLR